MALDIGNIEVYMGPRQLAAPDDLEAVIVGFMDRAQDTLDIAVQELESKPITQAILAAEGRGVRVRVALERDYLAEYPARADPWRAGGGNEPNRRLHSTLMRANVPVITDLNPDLFHQKFMVADWETSSRAAVLTGSTNFTPTGTEKNLNHVLIVRGKRTATVYRKEFDEVWSGTFGQKRERHDGPPRTYDVSRVKVKALFAPDHAPEMEIMKQMLKAKKSIDFAVFTFSQSSGIDDTMIALQGTGIAVRGIIDRMQASQEWAASKGLRQAGVDIYRTKRVGGLGKLHHKLMVIDGEVVISGSFNYTGPATALNDENVVVVGDLSEDDPDAKARQRQLGQFAVDEIDRIINEFGKRM